MKNTTYRGDVAELMAAAELARLGYVVAKPLTNGAPYDLLVDSHRGIDKVQVKRAVRSHYRGSNGAIRIHLSNTTRDNQRKMYYGRVDMVVGVDCDLGGFYVIHGDDMLLWEVMLRLDRPKNNQSAGVRYATNYDLVTMFPMVGGAGIEPATSSMSTKRSPAELTARVHGEHIHIAETLYSSKGLPSHVKNGLFLLTICFH